MNDDACVVPQTDQALSGTSTPYLPRLHPDAAMLLVTVAAFLDELSPQLQGADRYRSRIAVNVLRIVQRELAGRDAVDRAEREELAAMLKRVLPPEGGASGSEAPSEAATGEASAAPLDERLAEAIRTGLAPLDDADLLRGLQRSIERALHINNPKWLRP